MRSNPPLVRPWKHGLGLAFDDLDLDLENYTASSKKKPFGRNHLATFIVLGENAA